MKKIIAAIGISLAFATPAYADEGRAEVRGGVIWGLGDSEGTAGVALGYDWSLGDSAFVGVEVSGDKILEDNTKIAFGATARLGVQAGETTKIFADGGYTSKPCTGCDDSIHLGAGIEQAVGSGVYVKVAYRHFFADVDDFDAIVGGVGLHF